MTNEELREVIGGYAPGQAIFMSDLLKDLKEKLGFVNVKSIYVGVNRLVKNHDINQFMKGVYYKPVQTVMGEVPLDSNLVVEKKYIMSDNDVIGYYTGKIFINSLGLTTQLPKCYEVVTNNWTGDNGYYIDKLNLKVYKPKIEITKENYKYLQILDVLCMDKDYFEVEDYAKIIFDYINKEGLLIQNIFKYAKLTNNKKAVLAMYEMGGLL